MILTGTEVLDEFTRTHADTRNWISNWIADVKANTWAKPQDIKDRYSSVSFVKELVIFNVKGNSYRLEVQVSYDVGFVNVEWAGTHAEYDKRNEKR